MGVRFTLPLVALVIFSAPTRAEKIPPLVSMQFGSEKKTFIFDPAKITAVAMAPTFSVEKLPGRGNFRQTRGPNAPHVWGVMSGPIAINDSPEHFLEALKLTNKFITLHNVAGEVRLRATSISLIHAPVLKSDVDLGIKASVYNGALGVSSTSGTPTPWSATETPDEVRKLVDEKRAQQD